MKLLVQCIILQLVLFIVGKDRGMGQEELFEHGLEFIACYETHQLAHEGIIIIGPVKITHNVVYCSLLDDAR